MADLTVQDLIRQEAQRAGVPPELALSVAEQESSFNPTAVGPRLGTGENAIGTFQLLPSTAKRLGVDPNDPTQNIRGGVQYLRELLDRHQGDLDAVLKEYGGVKTDQTYVPSVRAKLAKYAGASTTPPPKPMNAATALAGTANVLPGIKGLAGMAGLDPTTSQGQRNLGGMAGASLANMALTTAFPEIGLPANAALWSARALRAVTPVLGAYLGGAGAAGGQQVAAGGPPTPSVMQEAGGEQAKLEAGGQAAMRGLVQPVMRRIGASAISKRVSQGLSDALDAVGKDLQALRPSESPSRAGQLFDQVAQGPAKSVKDQLGEAVGEAAKGGPEVNAAPLRAKLDELAAQITPMASHAQAEPLMIGGMKVPPEQVQALAEKHPELGLTLLPPEHPLPAALDRIREALGDHETIPFEEAHKIKTLLDGAVSWDRTAKKPAEQITKGFRQSLRQVMASHEPYNQATEAYGTVARLYQDVGATKLHSAIEANPSAVVSKIDWKNPATIGLIKEITQLPTEEAGAHQGEAAFHAVRSAWTNENLIAKGPKAMANEIDRIEASNSGQEFVQAMYGDPAGQTQWQNLKDIAKALRSVQGETKQFAQSGLGRATEPAGVVRDVGYALYPGHGITKMGATARLVFGRGTHAGEMLEWASRTPATTQFVIKHVLTGPNPGMALADFSRWWYENQPDRARESTPPPDQGPPRPQSLQAPRQP
jgi:hypothetical protein